MKLWRLHTDLWWYGWAEAMIVRAETEADARRIATEARADKPDVHIWQALEVACEEIQIEGAPGVILVAEIGV